MWGEGTNNLSKHIKEIALFFRIYWSPLKCQELDMLNFEGEFLSPLRIDKKWREGARLLTAEINSLKKAWRNTLIFSIKWIHWFLLWEIRARQFGLL